MQSCLRKCIRNCIFFNLKCFDYEFRLDHSNGRQRPSITYSLVPIYLDYSHARLFKNAIRTATVNNSIQQCHQFNRTEISTKSEHRKQKKCWRFSKEVENFNSVKFYIFKIFCMEKRKMDGVKN